MENKCNTINMQLDIIAKIEIIYDGQIKMMELNGNLVFLVSY